MKTLGELLGCSIGDEFARLQVNGVSDDSRVVNSGNMFVAVSGNAADGKIYINDAISKGAKFTVEESSNGSSNIELKDDVVKVYVPNVRMELAHIASKFFESEFSNVVAVTGTNGKSSTVDIIRQIWNFAGRSAASIGTLGIITKSEHKKLSGNLTSPGSIELHKILHDLCSHGVDSVAMEASSHGIEQHRLDDVKFNVCAFTNLTQDHLDYHKTIENYWLAKSKLFSDLADADSRFVVNADSEYASAIYEIANRRKIKCVSYGYNSDDVKILSAKARDTYQQIEALFFGHKIDFKLPLQGTFQIYNSLCAATSCYLTGVEQGTILEALENLSPINGRLELVASYKGANIYIDYAHTPDALKNAILSLRNHTQNRLVVLFGCGGNRDMQKREIMGRIASEFADKTIVTDDNPRNEVPSEIRKMILAGCSDATEIEGRENAIKSAIDNLQEGDTLLIAGKGHEDYQLINGEKIHFSDKEVILNKVAL
ncbi:MAG: UDP-N-acetylmuramoyl-L-alanyl-D-glutamate--2,6-diaminopimelate ligase [Alphaproteobacteria bacterium]|nr:UDP-N-acetylmuramoyl-L-alanyl-D-glutamate--2,6-diaminopimelate ligase [Alphaproteobacteria bacterium]